MPVVQKQTEWEHMVDFFSLYLLRDLECEVLALHTGYAVKLLEKEEYYYSFLTFFDTL